MRSEERDDRSTSRRSAREELIELLTAYALVQRQARRLPRVVWARLGTRGIGAYVRVPLTSGFLRYLLEHRIRRSVTALGRGLHERAALSPDVSLDGEIRALDHFSQATPSVPYRRLTVTFLLAVLLVAYGLSNWVSVPKRTREESQQLSTECLRSTPGAQRTQFGRSSFAGLSGLHLRSHYRSCSSPHRSRVRSGFRGCCSTGIPTVRKASDEKQSQNTHGELRVSSRSRRARSPHLERCVHESGRST